MIERPTWPRENHGAEASGPRPPVPKIPVPKIPVPWMAVRWMAVRWMAGICPPPVGRISLAVGRLDALIPPPIAIIWGSRLQPQGHQLRILFDLFQRQPGIDIDAPGDADKPASSTSNQTGLRINQLGYLETRTSTRCQAGRDWRGTAGDARQLMFADQSGHDRQIHAVFQFSKDGDRFTQRTVVLCHCGSPLGSQLAFAPQSDDATRLAEISCFGHCLHALSA